MGYSEVLCHICGVSFNIGRIRRPDEARSAAWSRFGGDSFVHGGRNSHIGECHRDSGCLFTMREAVDKGIGYAVDERGKRRLEKPDTNDSHDESKVDYAGPPFNRRWGISPIDIPRHVDDEVEYVYESSDGGEPLEYDSDEEMADAYVAVADEDSESQRQDSQGANDAVDCEERYRDFWYRVLVTDEEACKTLGENTQSYASWYRSLPPGIEPASTAKEDPTKPKDEMFPLFYPIDRDDVSEHGSDSSYTQQLETGTHEESHDKLCHWISGKLGYHFGDECKVEHIAGPNCLNLDGYNGHNISAEEMRGCSTLQCLVRKPPQGAMLRYQSDVDDEVFERSSNFFLSGLSDYMPSRDMDFPRVYPERHGCERPHAENCIWDPAMLEEYAMPFHPSCLEVYKRASQRAGSTEPDIVGLTDWWTVEADYDKFHQMERENRDPKLYECHSQEWKHVAGTEYLAANPLFVPALPALLQQVVSTDPSFDPRNGAFDVPDQPASSHASTATDPFATLPHELRMLVLGQLPSKDIANLRLVSRSFRQLPQTFFHDLLIRDMPWLWEVWDTTPYAQWACTTAAALKASDERYTNASQAVRDYVNIVKEEMPELTAVMNELARVYQESLDLEAHHARVNAAAPPTTLPRGRTDWYMLYTLMTRHMRRGELKGLQNRRRIWKDCGEILRRIGKYLEGGVFPIQDAKTAVAVRDARLRERLEKESSYARVSTRTFSGGL